MGAAYELAHLNLGFMREPLDHPVMAEFVRLMDGVNRAALDSPGFVWTPTGDACAEASRLFGSDRAMPNLSVWRSVEDLRSYVYRGGHGAALARRHDWFEPPTGPAYVLWWVPQGHHPSLAEGKTRLDRLAADGPSPEAFTFRAPFDPPV